MIRLLKRMLIFAGEYAGQIKVAFVISFFESIFLNVPIIVLLLVLMKIMDGSIKMSDAWIFGGILLGSVIIQCILRRLFVGLQSGAGYKICARERMIIGNRLKHFPMGYFTEGNIGKVSSAIAVDLTFIEENGMSSMDKVVNAYISIVIGCAMLLSIDFRIALISIVVSVVAIISLNGIQKVAKKQAPIRQKQQEAVTSAVLEYTKGISVIKAFNMAGDKAKNIKKTFEETRDHAIEFEEEFVVPSIRYDTCFSVGIALTVFAVAYFCFYGSLDIAVMIMIAIFIFRLYMPAKSMGTLSGIMRVMEAGLDRYEELKNVEIIDKDGRDMALNRFDIQFNNVTFAYENQDILKDISFTTPEHSMTALVGASGSGKTTIANLIVRFWDVQQGEVLIGGVNVKEMTCDSLLKNISMVFQNVYLFKDTISNNIKFGKPDATYEEVVEAAKKARCHDFIMALENGYETVVGESGSTLSGGEKQRISIARAILKDAPIILLDEATASVDPDNEKHIQAAINALVKDKTLIVIAHRLSTIKNADQILVIDNGKLVQKGTHSELMSRGGVYSQLWNKRLSARGWKISANAV